MYKGSSGYTITVPQLVLNGGSIRVGNDNTSWTIQGSATIQTASRFNYANINATTVIAAALSGTGGLSTAGAVLTETFALAGNNSAWSGGLTFNGGGKLSLNSATAPGTGVFTIGASLGAATIDNTSAADLVLSTAMPQRWAGDFTFAGTRSLHMGQGVVTLLSNRVVTVTANTLTIGGSVGESGGIYGLTKAGAGTCVLAASNTFSGAVTVSGGEIRVRHDKALGSISGETTVTSSGKLSMDHAVIVSNELVTIAGGGPDFNGALQAMPDAMAVWAGPVVLGDAGARVGAGTNGVLTISGPILSSGVNQTLGISAGRYGRATVVLAGSGNTYTGFTSIVRGTLKLGRTDAASTNAILDVDSSSASEPAIFDLAGFSQTVGGLRRSGASEGWGIITNSEATASILTVNQADTSTFSGTIAAGALALVKAGSGTLTLSGACAFGGGTTISNGTLKIASAGALSTNSAVTLAGGHLDITEGSPIGAPATVPSLVSESGNLILSTTNRLNITGNLSGALVVSISDTQNLNVNQVYILATYGGTPPASVMLSGLNGWIIRAVNHEIRLIKAKGTYFSVF